MKKKNRCGLLVLALLALAASAASTPASGAALVSERPSADANVIPGRYIVVYKGSADAVGAETDARERRLGFETDLRYRHALRGFAGKLSHGQVRALRRDPEVAYVAPDRTVQASALVPVVTGDTVPTGPRRLAGATTTTVEHASGTGVAVLDSGVDLTHPDLNVSHGVNCITPGASSDDDGGHGTHVAGTIAAKNNGFGVTGVAPGTKIWAVKVLNSAGSGSWSSIACGIDWVAANAAARNIKVLNMSLGGAGDPVGPCATTSDPLHSAVCRAAAADVLSVVAAGNDGWDFDFASQPDVPAAYPEVLTVTAMSDSDGRPGGTGGAPSCDPLEADDFPATFSSFAATSAGANHTIAAPGVCITSTWPTNLSSSGYATSSGTSMAAPHMAGIAALCENHDGRSGICAGKTPLEVITQLRLDAMAYTNRNPLHGFEHDPKNTPLAGVHFGHLTAVIDTRPPETWISSGPAGVTRWRDTTFGIESNELTGRFECSLDGGAWIACAHPGHEVLGLSDGVHTFAVRAVDHMANVDPSPATRTWTIDSTAPETSIDSAPARQTASRSARFAFSSSEAGARLGCKLDAGEWTECSSPRRVTGLSDGKHTLLVAAIDAAGNVDPTPATHRWAVMPHIRRIESALSADLGGVVNRLKRFGIGKLVKHRGFKAKGIQTLLAGKLSVVINGKLQGRAGVARNAVLAKGARSVSRAERYAVKVKLTRQGRRVLRRDRRARVTIRVKFGDELGRTTTTSRSVGLRR